MIKSLKTRFVIADGEHARWVGRSASAHDFVTDKAIGAAHHAHTGGPRGVVFEGSTGQRFSVERKSDAVRQRQLAFAQEIADAINAEADRGAFDRLAIVAPTRMLSAIKQRLKTQANAKLAKTLAKDLVKVPDHDLAPWLDGLERG